MKKLIIAILLTITVLNSYSQAALSDSTPLLSIKQIDYLLFHVKERVKDKMTVKEFEDLTQIFNRVINESAEAYQRRKKQTK